MNIGLILIQALALDQYVSRINLDLFRLFRGESWNNNSWLSINTLWCAYGSKLLTCVTDHTCEQFRISLLWLECSPLCGDAKESFILRTKWNLTYWRHVCADADLALISTKTHLEFRLLKLLLMSLQSDVHLGRAPTGDLRGAPEETRCCVVLFMFNQQLLTSTAPKKPTLMPASCSLEPAGEVKWIFPNHME